MKLHAGDPVVIITGKDRGKTGRILRVLHEKERVVVAGLNMRTRHIRKTTQAPGRVVRYEASIHASNVMAVDPKTKKRTRIGFREKDGKWERIAKKSGELLVSGRKLRKLLEEETKDKGQREKDKGQREKDKGQREKDKGSHSP